MTDTPVLTITTDTTARTVSVTALVNMDTLIMPAVGGKQVIEIGSVNAAYKDISFVELAIALDTTTSMRLGTGASATIQPSDPAQRRINIMKAAAITFINGLYTQGGTLQDSVSNLRVSLIPFTSMVNVGSQHTNFLASGSLTGLQWDYPKNATPQNSWRGCVFERSFYSNLTTGGSYSGNDVKDTSPAIEPFYPYNVAPQHMEVGWNCGNLPAPPPPPAPPAPPPAPPPPAPPPPPVCVDGVCLKHLMVKPILETCRKGVCGSLGQERKSGFETISFRLGQDGTKPSLPRPEIQKVGLATPGGVCVYGSVPTGWWASYRLYAPAYSVEGQDGIWAHANSYDTNADNIGDGVFSAACMPGAASPLKDNCNLANPFGGGWNLPRSCCLMPGMNAPNFYGPSGWTKTGRWIAPWPNTASPKLGGWGNSGCGAPMVPLTDDRPTIINAINALDVPLERDLSLPDLGYSGTLINEGLVWAWRSISPNWRGYWKDSGGMAIDATLPRDYGSAGSSKAVVVMTDGLNFLPARDIRHSYPAAGVLFEQQSVFTNNTTTNVLWPMAGDPNLFSGNGGRLSWSDVDSSAYGVLHSPNNEVEFCNMRTSKGFEPMLTAGMGCRPYACMIRNAAGVCLKTNFNPWAPDWRDALIGPYYNELLSRLVTTCTNMRAQGVRVFFILFALNDNPQKASTMAALDSCVGSGGKVYDAADAAELNTAFADILAQIRRLSLMH